MLNIVITGANQGIGYYFTEQALKKREQGCCLGFRNR